MSQSDSGCTVLIVDDSEIVLELMRATLEGAGYRVLTLASPFGTSGIIAREAPDVVLLDVSMPGLDGTELVSLARRAGGARDCRIVLFSDRPAKELERLAKEAGADGYIPKSLDEDEILRQVARFAGTVPE